VYVFDGKPPTLKLETLRKRKVLREENQEKQEKAEEEGNIEDAVKHAKRNIKVTKDIVNQAKELLTLMGIPWMDAESEAEATCVELLKTGKV